MSHHAPATPTDITIPETSLWAKLPMLGGVVGVVGLGATLAAAMGEGRARAMFSYLWAFELFLGLALAALGFMVIDYSVRAAWSGTVKRIAENMMATLPLFALLIIPIVTIGFHDLYPWTHETDAILERKRWFLSNGFFFGRMVFYFLVWIGFSQILYRGSVSQDTMSDPAAREKVVRRLWKVSAAGIIFYALTQSFAAIDWMMSLQPHWYSTIFGVYFFAASIQAFFAFMALIAMSLQRAGVLKDAITVEHFHDLGKYTFGFTIFWAYIAFSQFMLIWYANLPEETVFYMTRVSGGWEYISYGLPVAHFFVPFLYLISRQVKRSRKLLAIGAGWTLFMYAVDFFWLILPNYGAHGEGTHEPHLQLAWTDFAALIGMGGMFFAALAFMMKRAKVIAVNDPRLPEALAHENY